jgi:hypothetical protein
MNAGLDAALTDKQSHEQRNQGHGSREAAFGGDHARRHPSRKRDRGVPGRHPAHERVRRMRERLAEQHDDSHEHECDERQVHGCAPDALQRLQRKRA